LNINAPIWTPAIPQGRDHNSEEEQQGVVNDQLNIAIEDLPPKGKKAKKDKKPKSMAQQELEEKQRSKTPPTK